MGESKSIEKYRNTGRRNINKLKMNFEAKNMGETPAC